MTKSRPTAPDWYGTIFRTEPKTKPVIGPLLERARWIRHAEFFVGLASGLSWLAWSVGTPVVMISGFSHPLTEFQTPYRVINYHTCNSCWNMSGTPSTTRISFGALATKAPHASSSAHG